MSDRKKPSEVAKLSLVNTSESGEIVEALPVLSQQQEQMARWDKKFYTGSQILENLQPTKWLIDGWLPLGGLVSVYAEAKKGKSFYALSMALEIARGGDFGETMFTEPRKVLYVAAERAVLQRDRYAAWLKWHEVETLDTFTLLGVAPQLQNPSDVAWLCERITEGGYSFVVLDTFARMTLGVDENSSKDMSPLMGSLDQIRDATNGGAVLVVHHTGKNVGAGARGSSAFLAALDVGITLEGDPSELTAKAEEQNAGAPPLPLSYKLETVLLDGATEQDPKRSSAVLVSVAYREVMNAHEVNVRKVLSELGSATAKQIREALLESGKNCSQSTVNRTLRALMKSGKVASDGKVTPKYSLA